MLIARFQKNYLSLTKMSDIHPKNTFAVKKARPRNYKYLEPNVKNNKKKQLSWSEK